MKDQIITVLTTNSHPMSCREIAEELEVKHFEISRTLTDLTKNGVLERLEGDKYHAATYVLATTTATTDAANKPAITAEVAAMNEQRSTKQKEEMRDYLTTAGIIAGNGAYHGMTEPHPDDAPEIKPAAKRKKSTYPAELKKALAAAKAALQHYQAKKHDPIESSLKGTVSTLITLIEEADRHD